MPSQERFGRKYPHGKIAQTVEMRAGRDFGPEGLKKAEVARCLNLRENDISNAEWTEISEFAVNAGAEMIQATIASDMPKNPKTKDVNAIRKNILANEKNTHMVAFHDLFHAALAYRLSQGKSTVPRFLKLDSRSRYIDAQSGIEELYVGLFLPPGSESAPAPVCFRDPRGRQAFYDQLVGRPGISGADKENIKKYLLENIPSDSTGWRRQYEAVWREGLIASAKSAVQNITEDEIEMMRENCNRTIADPPEYFDAFATRVFNDEWRDNPRLFLDELLDCIRTRSNEVNEIPT